MSIRTPLFRSAAAKVPHSGGTKEKPDDCGTEQRVDGELAERAKSAQDDVERHPGDRKPARPVVAAENKCSTDNRNGARRDAVTHIKELKWAGIGALRPGRGARALLVLGTERVGGNDLTLGTAGGWKKLQRGTVGNENDRGLSQRAFDRREPEPKPAGKLPDD